MNMVTVRVNGIEYNLKGDEKEEYLHKVASYVDKKMKRIMENNPKLSTSAAAVLTALNVTDEIYKCDDYIEKLEKSNDDLEKKEATYKETIESLKKQLKHMESYNQELKHKVNIIKSQEKSDGYKEKYQKLNEEYDIVQEEAKKIKQESEKLKQDNKELRFNLQTSKYKIIELEKKFFDNQIDYVKTKKQFLKENFKK